MESWEPIEITKNVGHLLNVKWHIVDVIIIGLWYATQNELKSWNEYHKGHLMWWFGTCAIVHGLCNFIPQNAKNWSCTTMLLLKSIQNELKSRNEYHKGHLMWWFGTHNMCHCPWAQKKSLAWELQCVWILAMLDSGNLAIWKSTILDSGVWECGNLDSDNLGI